MSFPDFIGGNSQAELGREAAARYSLQQWDLISPTSRKIVIDKTHELQASKLLGYAGDALLSSIPTLNNLFETEMVTHLSGEHPEQLLPTVTGSEIVAAFDRTGAFRRSMSFPDSYGRLLDHYGVPIKEAVLDKIQDPQVLKEYRSRNKQWVEDLTQE